MNEQEANEELQSLIADLNAQLGDKARVELIDLNESDGQPEQTAEPQGQPGPELSNDLLAMIGNALKKAVGDSTTVIPLHAQCYHYILDVQGNPVHCDDNKKLMEFQERGGHILAVNSFFCHDFAVKVMTEFAVHNPMIGNEPPLPRWVTTAMNVGTGDIDFRASAKTFKDSMELHRTACATVRRKIAKLYKEASNE